MIEATLALSRSLGSIDSTVGSTTDKALRASWYSVKDYPLGEFIGSLWGVHVYARDFGKNEIAMARYLRGVGFKLCNVPRKSCSLESEVGFKALQRNLRNPVACRASASTLARSCTSSIKESLFLIFARSVLIPSWLSTSALARMPA